MAVAAENDECPAPCRYWAWVLGSPPAALAELANTITGTMMRAAATRSRRGSPNSADISPLSKQWWKPTERDAPTGARRCQVRFRTPSRVHHLLTVPCGTLTACSSDVDTRVREHA